MKREKTIHDQAQDGFQLAMTYAEDGAFISAARVLRQIADMYEKRANDLAGYTTP